MDEIISFLSSYEEELQFEADFLTKSITRLELQIKDIKKSIRDTKKKIDASYKVFSASQSNNEIETKIDTFQEIIEDKNKQIEELNNKRNEIKIKLLDISNLNYKNIYDPGTDSGLLLNQELNDKLIIIRKFMDVDIRRAKLLLDQVIDKLDRREEI